MLVSLETKDFRSIEINRCVLFECIVKLSQHVLGPVGNLLLYSTVLMKLSMLSQRLRKQKLLRQLPLKVIFGWTLVYFETCWFDESHTHFILPYQCSKERNLKKQINK